MMPARIRFLGRYGNAIAIFLVGCAAVSGIGEDGFGFSVLSACLVAAVALSVHASERMAFVASEADWHKAELREAELRKQAIRLHPNMLENV
jgi:hypothetical protein